MPNESTSLNLTGTSIVSVKIVFNVLCQVNGYYSHFFKFISFRATYNGFAQKFLKPDPCPFDDTYLVSKTVFDFISTKVTHIPSSAVPLFIPSTKNIMPRPLVFWKS